MQGNALGIALNYALGLDPRTPVRAPLTSSKLRDIRGGTYLEMEYTSNPEATDLVITAETSSNLTDWSPAAGEISRTAAAGLETVVVWDRVAGVAGTNPKRFTRLKLAFH